MDDGLFNYVACEGSYEPLPEDTDHPECVRCGMEVSFMWEQGGIFIPGPHMRKDTDG